MTEPSSSTSTRNERIRMRAIGELIGAPAGDTDTAEEPCRFFVPSYQRGYRWGPDEVNALMDDLRPYFGATEQDYCLQPIVVRKLTDGRYEVIDGQQRLTTIFILMQYASSFLSANSQRKSKLYSLDYETRPGSQAFLRNLSLDTINGDEAESNPDFHYMAQTLRTIDRWTDTHNKEAEDLISFRKSIREHVKVIWYEILPSDDPIDMFRKINVGKIPLTNAELVKGLLIADAKGPDSSPERVAAISGEWDRIEHRLHDDGLWYFLTDGTKGDYPTRMDLVLDIWWRTVKDQPEWSGKREAIDESNPYRIFQTLYSYPPAERTARLHRMWTSCKEIFANLESWYEQRDLYHLVGYLIAHRDGKKGKTTTDIRNLYAKLAGLDKSEMRDTIRGMILDTLNDGKHRCGETPETISDLTYGDGDATRNILLLFNLLTINETTSSVMRFPFDLYKKEHWDLEHVHATAGGPPTDDETRKGLDPAQARRAFFEELRNLLIDDETTPDEPSDDATDDSPETPADDAAETTSDASGDAAASDASASPEPDEPASQVVQDFLDKGEFDEQSCMDFWNANRDRFPLDEQDDIDNMALLSDHINRGYGNASFIEKRRWIIDADRNTTFVPPCTKNVFLKYYSDNPKDFLIWGKRDRRGYLWGKHGIISTITRYLRPDEQADRQSHPQTDGTEKENNQ